MRHKVGPQNNALHLTRRRGVAASRPVVEGRLAGERECYPGRCGLTRGGLNSIGNPTDSAAHE